MDIKNIQNDFVKAFFTLWGEKKTFFIVWGITFVLSCIWILPQPRTYTCVTTVAPESSDQSLNGSMASLAASFGINVGSNGQDAIYPQIYPNLFESTEFLVELCDIQITTKDGELQTDYFDYMKNHQKINILLYPVYWTIFQIDNLRYRSETTPIVETSNGKRFNPFCLDRKTSLLFLKIRDNIKCSYSQTTDIVTITVKDQDPLVCALMADSVKLHLQNYITQYRTQKARLDYDYYTTIYNQSRAEFETAAAAYAEFCDAHQNITSTATRTKKDALQAELQRKSSILDAVATRLEAAQAKVQEVTPAFTTIKNSTVPYRASKPKRMLFVLAMLILSTLGTAAWILRKELLEWF